MSRRSTRLVRSFSAAVFGAIVGLIGSAGVVMADPPAAAAAGAPTSLSPAASAPEVVDAGALDRLKKAENTMFGLRSYQAECWTTWTYDPRPEGKTPATRQEMGILLAAKPNFMHYDTWNLKADSSGALTKTAKTPEITFVSDGKTYWKQFGKFYRLDKRIAPKDMGTILEPWVGFYATENSLFGEAENYRTHDNGLLEVSKTGTEMVDGIPCNKVYVHTSSKGDDQSVDYKTTWFIGPDNLVHRRVRHVQFGTSPGFTQDASLRAIKTNFPVDTKSALFAYKPPAGVVPESERKTPALLAKGTTAPDFTATDKDGNAVTLASLKGKVVVIDFWASWCPPCKASMPHNQEVTKKLQDAGVPVVLLAVDNSEDHDAFAAWVKAHPELSSLNFAYIDPKKTDLCNKIYQVSGIPTQYVVDAKGVIQASFVGYDQPNDDLENAVRAALKGK